MESQHGFHDCVDHRRHVGLTFADLRRRMFTDLLVRDHPADVREATRRFFVDRIKKSGSGWMLPSWPSSRTSVKSGSGFQIPGCGR